MEPVKTHFTLHDIRELRILDPEGMRRKVEPEPQEDDPLLGLQNVSVFVALGPEGYVYRERSKKPMV